MPAMAFWASSFVLKVPITLYFVASGWAVVISHFPLARSAAGVVTLSHTERNLPTIANVDARDFKDLACWLIVQIGPISLNVTTPSLVFFEHAANHPRKIANP